MALAAYTWPQPEASAGGGPSPSRALSLSPEAARLAPVRHEVPRAVAAHGLRHGLGVLVGVVVAASASVITANGTDKHNTVCVSIGMLERICTLNVNKTEQSTPCHDLKKI